MSVHETIAENIRKLRRDRGWSVRQLAEECAKRGMASLTQASLGNIERRQLPTEGRAARRVTVDELVFIAELFGVKPNDLFDAPTWAVCDRCGGMGRVVVPAGGGAL